MVGSGHLAHALWEGWHQKGIDVEVIARSNTHQYLWDDDVWHSVVRFDPLHIEGKDAVVLAVKPKDMQDTTARIKPHLMPSTMIISPVAGWTTTRIRELGIANPVARVMPNVCAAVGASTTLVAFSRTTEAEKSQVLSLFSSCGTVAVMDETLMDPYTALVGSGPAYIFLLLEALIAGGEQLGADAGRTRELVSRMVEGAARLARDRSKDSLSDWISQVASPGGTTEALLEVLRQGGWPTLIQEAIVAASERAQQLGQAR